MTFEETVAMTNKLMEQKRYRSAKAAFEKALSKYHQHTLFIAYNYGAFNHMSMGNGEEARRLYAKALDGRRLNEGYAKPAVLDEIESHIFENMMLLSLSYEEYYSWASRLKTLHSENNILKYQRPKTEDAERKGVPWTDCMTGMAVGYSRPSLNVSIPAAIYQLLLKHRKELRLIREKHRLAAIPYCGAISLIWSDCGSSMQTQMGRVDHNEFNFIVEDAIPLVKEYIDKNPDDDVAQEGFKKLSGLLACTSGNVRIPGEIQIRREQMSSFFCGRCGYDYGETAVEKLLEMREQRQLCPGCKKPLEGFVMGDPKAYLQMRSEITNGERKIVMANPDGSFCLPKGKRKRKWWNFFK